MENDIGLMRLSRPVQYKDHIRSICIGVDPSPIYLSLIDRQFHEYTGTAWDRTNQEKYEIGDFYAINITRVSRNYCQSVRMVQDENPKFCGWNPKANESCDGPSGSALSRVMHDTIYQFGIASYKERDCQRMRTYTNVARFSEWIQRTVNFYGSPKDQKINQPVLFPTDSTKSTPVKSQLRNSQQNANSNFRKITPNNRERSQWSRV
ncbi:hypothetical protein KR054_001462 [Drosophila jambulina]|nr:hypothetical protein KR054_001462 [Drosophila jambulina]